MRKRTQPHQTEQRSTPISYAVNPSPKAPLDVRERIQNEGGTGSFADVQLPAERITKLNGIILDLDPKLLAPGNGIFEPDDSPRAFYDKIVNALGRHPLARSAEVRISGTGVHLILWLQPAVELMTAADQRRWSLIVRAVQTSLPSDPDMPGITAVTRPVGSINSKNGARVEKLKDGERIDPATVEEFIDLLRRRPFREVALPLLGEERVSPCPVCRRSNTRMDVLDWVGKCYESCGKITLGHLYDRIFLPRDPNPSSPPDAAAVIA